MSDGSGRADTSNAPPPGHRTVLLACPDGAPRHAVTDDLEAAGYAEFKNVIARVAQVKEAMRERDWRVTPRT